MRLFISQPMRNRTDKEIKEERREVIKRVTEMLDGMEKLEIIDSFFEGAPYKAKPLWFLGKSLELLSTADVAYFCKGWYNARGCRIEYQCASEYDIGIITDSEDIL